MNELCVARLRSALLGGTTLPHYLILFRLAAKDEIYFRSLKSPRLNIVIRNCLALFITSNFRLGSSTLRNFLPEIYSPRNFVSSHPPLMRVRQKPLAAIPRSFCGKTRITGIKTPLRCTSLRPSQLLITFQCVARGTFFCGKTSLNSIRYTKS